MATIADNLQAVAARIDAAEAACARAPGSVALLAVSKTQPAEAVVEAYRAGQRAFGENYAQEGMDKILAVRTLLAEAPPGSVEWHFIGPLQSNKTRTVAEHFDWVHAVDRLRIAERLSQQRPAALPPLQVCIQVNISGETTKSGVAPDEVSDLARAVAALPNLRLRGLMAIPEPAADASPAERRRPFAELRRLLEALRGQGLDVDTLSMGMSDDLEDAICEGTTMVRVGTAIFGMRRKPVHA